MKNLTNRNKIVLAIVSLLVIVVIAVAAFAQVGGGQLFGTTTYPYFNPASANIIVGGTVTLKVVGNPVAMPPNCTFTTSSGAASLNRTAIDTVVVTGVGPGSATITAACNVGTLSTNITVNMPPVPIILSSPTITVGLTLHLEVGMPLENCSWSIPAPPTGQAPKLQITTPWTIGSYINVLAVASGTQTVNVTCDAATGTATGTTTVTVNKPPPPTITPTNPIITPGQTILLMSYDLSCHWSASSPVVSLDPSNLNGGGVRVTGKSGGTATVTATCGGGSTSTTVTVNLPIK